jgi:hypothetical protein
MSDRDVVGDDDPELARFFAGENMSGPLIEDGGKGLTYLDAEPDKDVEEGLSNEEFWKEAELAKNS